MPIKTPTRPVAKQPTRKPVRPAEPDSDDTPDAPEVSVSASASEEAN